MHKNLLLLLLISFAFSLKASDSLANESMQVNKAKFHFHHRSFFMHTNNHGKLTNYSTLAAGAGLAFYSKEVKNFSFGFSGFFVYQIFEKNIYSIDPTTGNTNRYEIALYDMDKFEPYQPRTRLDELYVQYKKRNTKITYGNQSFESPLLNGQDNRMHPNLFHGTSFYTKWKNIDFSSAWFTHVSMRGTGSWFSISESFGVYPFGRNPSGTSSSYAHQTHSNGIGIIGLKHNSNFLKTQVWSYTASNVFQLFWLQLDKSIKHKKNEISFGFQSFYETPIANGGNANQELAYIKAGEKNLGIGAKIGYKIKNSDLSINGLILEGNGRFLFPREWGREQFYASLPRERMEGNGNSQGITMKLETKHKKYWESMFGIGYYKIISPDNIVLNKYGLPSYFHIACHTKYSFQKYLKGTDISLLFVYKPSQNPNSVLDVYRLNRVDLWQINAVVNYKIHS
jgi:hypothetical protein